MKLYALFGLICFLDNNQWGESCVNFWEDPVIHYRSLGECDAAGKRKGLELRAYFDKNGLKITQGELWCIESKQRES